MKPLKVIVIGSAGMLGSDFCQFFADTPHTVIPISHSECDITRHDSVKDALQSHHNADWLINCAAFTKVDDCESNSDIAYAVNADGPKHLAQFAAQYHMPLIHFSTDYIFSGAGDAPYCEADAPDPQSVYGASKLLGEHNILQTGAAFYIFRVQWLYGQYGYHFIRSILKAVQNQSVLKIVNDQWGSPTWTWEIVRCVVQFIEKKPEFGVYHLATQGYTNWCEFANYFLSKLNYGVPIEPQSSDQICRPAHRPLNSRLNLDKLKKTGVALPLSWQLAVDHYLEKEGEQC